MAKIILRPHASDTELSPKIFDLLKIFSDNVPNFEIDNSEQSSTDFYKQCDILISDASTGGVTFMSNKIMPPIYFIPKKYIETNLQVNNFVELQKDKVLFAHSITELIKQINTCINLSKEQRINYFNNFCENDLFLNVDNTQLLQKIIDKKLDNFHYVDENGNFL